MHDFWYILIFKFSGEMHYVKNVQNCSNNNSFVCFMAYNALFLDILIWNSQLKTRYVKNRPN
jgi:hypothetical protein